MLQIKQENLQALLPHRKKSTQSEGEKETGN